MAMFWILSILIIVSAIAVVLLPNPLHGALCLALNLVSVAGMYALVGAHFLAAVQIIVYAGAIMVLVVFVLMLLNVKAEQHGGFDFLMLVVALSAAGFCGSLVWPIIGHEFAAKDFVVAGSGDAPMLGTAEQLGKKLFNEQSFLFQLSGAILITAIVGAVMLASQRRPAKAQRVE